MDLRQRKTERALRQAFFELRRDFPTSRITVRALCERAEVAPATFYLHYHDMRELSTTMQEELIERVVESMPDATSVFTESDRFTRDLLYAVREHDDEVSVLFSGEDESALLDAVERRIYELSDQMAPGALGDIRFRTILTLQVDGAYWAWRKHGDGEDVIETIAQSARLLAEAFPPYGGKRD